MRRLQYVAFWACFGSLLALAIASEAASQDTRKPEERLEAAQNFEDALRALRDVEANDKRLELPTIMKAPTSMGRDEAREIAKDKAQEKFNRQLELDVLRDRGFVR